MSSDESTCRRDALLAAAIEAIGAGATANTASTPHPDAELIAICAKIEALGLKYLKAHFGPDALDENDNDGLHAYLDKVWGEWDTLAAAIIDLPIVTFEGFRALARAAVATAPEHVENPREGSDVLVSALLVNLVGKEWWDGVQAFRQDDEAVDRNTAARKLAEAD